MGLIISMGYAPHGVFFVFLDLISVVLFSLFFVVLVQPIFAFLTPLASFWLLLVSFLLPLARVVSSFLLLPTRAAFVSFVHRPFSLVLLVSVSFLPLVLSS